MTHSIQDKACVIILGLWGEAKLEMELRKDEKVQKLADDIINSPHHFHCYSFQLPTIDADKDTSEVWLMHTSIKGENINVDQIKKVLIMKKTLVTFIQTDKPFYQPGQTVNFRVVTLDTSFQADNNKDPNGDRIAQWLDVSPDRGIASLSFPLANELQLGEYSIKIPNMYKMAFSVSEYVSPRFHVNVDVPTVLSVMQEAVTVKACGRYMYGKPVQGLIDLTVCKAQMPRWVLAFGIDIAFLPSIIGEGEDGECEDIKGLQTDNNGCISRAISLRQFNMSESDPEYLRTRASVTEKITGNTELSTTYSLLEQYDLMVFLEKVEHYQKGVPLTIKLSATAKDRKPLVSEKVYLVVGFEEEEKNLTAVTDIKGIATFELDTSTWEDMVSLEGKFANDNRSQYQYFKENIWLLPFYSESNSFLKVSANKDSMKCIDQQLVNVKYIINTSKLDPNSDHQSFFYFLVSKGAIVTYGEYKLDTSEYSTGSELRGSFSLKFTKTIEMYPEVTFVIFTVLLNGDVAAGRSQFTVPLCLTNKVKLKFSKDQVRPGEKVGLEVKAESGSICSVRSVDKGVLIPKKHEDLNLPIRLNEVTSQLLKVTRRGFPYQIEDFEKYPCFRNEKDAGPEIYEGAWYSSEADVYRLLKESNLKIFTNAKIRKSVVCDLPKANFTKRISPGRQNTLERQVLVAKKNEKMMAKIRRDFAETWLFDLVSVGPVGHTELNVTTPHSITTFVTDIFCLGKSSGFGETSNVELTTFQPYFIELIVPHSVVQGEQFTITVLIYNYLKECIMVFVSLSDVGDHSALVSKEQKNCICAEQSTKFTWNVTASQLGIQKVLVNSGFLQLEGGCTDKVLKLSKDHQEDRVEKRIVVKPSGVLVKKTQTSLLCPSENNIQNEISLDLPEGYVLGSEEAHIIVIGDLMGSAITELKKSNYNPNGCGEENIVNFIPNFHIIKYLETTNQLTPEIKTKAITYLIKGYQRQMLFKSENGSYSLFTGSKPSTWLTAFTLRSFVYAQELIHIPENIIDDSVRWLSKVQLPNGCFEKVGKAFTRFLQREEDDEVALAAFIAVTLLERKVFDGNTLERALQCLKDSVAKVNSTYTQAVMAYAFTLSRNHDLRKQILENLDKSAQKSDGTKHWEGDNSGHGGVEISAYVVLTILSDETTSNEDIEEASSIVRWMVKRQTARGGFFSLQDTVVGLEALTKYAKVTFRDNLEVIVSVRSLSGFQKQFNVDKANSLLSQNERLPDIPGVYRITATGNGCVYVQANLKYNMPAEKSETFFSLNVSTEPAVCTYQAQTKFDILISVSYSSERPVGRIAIIEVEMLSGYFPFKRSLKKLEKHPSVGRTEATDDKVTIYLDKLTHEPGTFSFSVKQDVHVSNLKPATVKIYDYSSPDESDVAEYNSPCSSDSEKEDKSY